MYDALLFLAGIRFGEASALRWSHYDAKAEPLGRLTIAKSYNTKLEIEKSVKAKVPRPSRPCDTGIFRSRRKRGSSRACSELATGILRGGRDLKRRPGVKWSAVWSSLGRISGTCAWSGTRRARQSAVWCSLGVTLSLEPRCRGPGIGWRPPWRRRSMGGESTAMLESFARPLDACWHSCESGRRAGTPATLPLSDRRTLRRLPCACLPGHGARRSTLLTGVPFPLSTGGNGRTSWTSLLTGRRSGA
jgi:hypothetical protein